MAMHYFFILTEKKTEISAKVFIFIPSVLGS